MSDFVNRLPEGPLGKRDVITRNTVLGRNSTIEGDSNEGQTFIVRRFQDMV